MLKISPKTTTMLRTVKNIATESLAHPNSNSYISRETGKVVQRTAIQPAQANPTSLKVMALSIYNTIKKSFTPPTTNSYISRETGKVLNKTI